MQILPSSLDEKIQVLAKNQYFSSLDENSLATLALKSSLRQAKPDEVVCWQGEPCAGLYILQRGSVKLFRISTRGRELIIQVLTEGATFNEVPVFDHGPNVINVAALEPSEIWLVEKEAILQVLNSHPHMALEVILSLSQNLRMLVGKVEELSFYQVTNRLARLIRQLDLENPSRTGARLTQDVLAARLGTVREVVARSLRDLERSGAIQVKRRQINILSAEILEEWAQVSGEQGSLE